MVRPKYIIFKWKKVLGLLFWTINRHRFHSENKTIEGGRELLVPFFFWSLSDKETKNPRINLRERWLIKRIWKYWVNWLPNMTLMETWNWTNNILLYTKHILEYMYVEFSSCLIRKNWNTRTAIYIYKHMCVHYLKVIFASSGMILTVVMDERTYLTYEKRLKWRESLTYLRGWHPTNAVSVTCLFQENVNVNLRHW